MFKKIAKLRVVGSQTAEFKFYQIEGEPSVIGHPATEANKPYLNAVLAGGRAVLRRMRKRKLSPEALQESREQDFVLYPKHVLVGFGTPPERDDGTPAVAEDMEAFLRALPVEMFDEMRAFFGDPDSFRAENELSTEDAEELSGNS